MKTYQTSVKTQSVMDRAFNVHPVTPDQQQRLESVHQKLESTARSLTTMIPECDELHDAIRMLNRVRMIAQDAISKSRE